MIDVSTRSAEGVAAARQSTLLSVLACPTCHGDLREVDAVDRDGTIVNAELECASCGPAGRIRAYRPTFLDHDAPAIVTSSGDVVEEIDLATAERTGHWAEVVDATLGDGVGARLSWSTPVTLGLSFRLAFHAWGGRVLVSCAGQHRLVDTYAPEPTDEIVQFDLPTAGPAPWSIEVVDGRPPLSHGDQVLVRSVGMIQPAHAASPHRFVPVNRGNLYPPRFEALLDGLPDDAVVFDLGGGDRVHTDRRVFNLEYLPYRGPDLYGDGHHLPIRTGSVDLVLSQAVLEHVPDPVAAVSEMRRVLRPGGLVYAEIAFMQPLHAVPFHYFNVTPHGLDLLFNDFVTIHHGTFGGLHETMEWLFRLVDASARIGPDRAGDVLEALTALDAELRPEELDQFASAVFIEAMKPTG